MSLGSPSPAKRWSDVFITGTFDNAGSLLRLRTAKTPSSSSDTGDAGSICWDENYIYVCTATNTWKRSPISTW